MKTYLMTVLMIFLLIAGMARAEDNVAAAVVWEYKAMTQNDIYHEASEKASAKDGDAGRIKVEAELGLKANANGIKDQISKLLNYMGKDGWEVCAYIEESRVFIFKKRLVAKKKD